MCNQEEIGSKANFIMSLIGVGANKNLADVYVYYIDFEKDDKRQRFKAFGSEKNSSTYHEVFIASVLVGEDYEFKGWRK